MTNRQRSALHRALRVARWIHHNCAVSRGVDLTKTNAYQQLAGGIKYMLRYRDVQITRSASGRILNAGLDREAHQAMLALAKLDSMIRLAKRYDQDARDQWALARRFEVPPYQRAEDERRARAA